MDKPRLVIIGASTRAAAFSALAGGYDPVCVDAFADVDLKQRCRVLRADDYPSSLPALAEPLPAAPWMYTGAMENHLDVVDAISQRRPLWGNASTVIRQVRSPERLAQQLTGPVWRFPAWQRTPPTNKRGIWLLKADRSGGGAQVQVWDPQQEPPHERAGWYFQQQVAGLPCAAVYVAAGRSVRLLGVSQQLIATEWSGASGFRYAGSLGPLPLATQQHDQFVQLGQQLVTQFGLVGLFGVDLVMADDACWVIEINPRYTASMEVLERAGGFSAVAWHATACRDGTLPQEPDLAGPVHGKVIVYARQDVSVPAELVRQALEANERLPAPVVADIPAPESHVRAGWPVMTLLAQAADTAALVDQLQRQAACWQQRLYGAS